MRLGAVVVVTLLVLGAAHGALLSEQSPSSATSGSWTTQSTTSTTSPPAPHSGYGMDCNGYSPVYLNYPPGLINCSDPVTQNGRFYDNGHYIGHDEVGVQFYSNVPGSANNIQWEITLPKDPAKPPTLNGSVVDTIELGTFWIGLSLCDSFSYPFNPCIPDSNSNVGGLYPAPAGSAGSAHLEWQFTAPYGASEGSYGGCAAKWCSAVAINSFVANGNCLAPDNYAFLTRNGVPNGPPAPGEQNISSILPLNPNTFVMNPGDTILATLKDTPAGLYTGIDDLTTGQTGFMVAGAANGFAHVNPADCSTSPYSFHPEYSTASYSNVNTWTSRSNVEFAWEIGHTELGVNGDNDTSNNDCTIQTYIYHPNDLLPECDGVGGGGTFNDVDFDGLSYTPSWPDGSPSHPTSIRIGSPLGGWLGPASFLDGNYSAPYSQMQFTTIVNGANLDCNGSTGAGCVIPPQGAAFYPFWTMAKSGSSCMLEFGNRIPGVTTYDFGGESEYGASEPFMHTLVESRAFSNPCMGHSAPPEAGSGPASSGTALTTALTAQPSTPVGSVTNTIGLGLGRDPYAVAVDTSTGYEFVTNMGSDSVSVLKASAAGNYVSVAVIPVGPSPEGIAYDPANGYMYVANDGYGVANGIIGQSISVIDCANNSVVGTIDSGGAPTDLVYDASNGYVYATSRSFSGIVDVINGMSEIAIIPVGEYPTGIAFDPQNGDLYVSNHVFFSPSVTVINGSSDQVLATISGVARDPAGIMFDPSNHEVYVAGTSPGNISVIQTSTDRVIANLTGIFPSQSPQSLAYDQSSGNLLVAQGSTGDIKVITSTGETVGDVAVPGSPGLVRSIQSVYYDPAAGAFYATQTVYPESMVAFSGSSLALLGSTYNGVPWGVAVDPRTGEVFLTDSQAQQVSVVDGMLQSLVANTHVDFATPEGIAFDSANGNLYVADSSTDVISVVSGSSYSDLTWFVPKYAPVQLAFDPANGFLYATTPFCCQQQDIQIMDLNHPPGTEVANVTLGAQWARRYNSISGIAYDSANGYVYAGVDGAKANLSVIDTSLDKVVTNVAVGTDTGVGGLAFDSSNGLIYAVLTDAAALAVVNGTSQSLIGSVALGGLPQDLAYDPSNGYVYVTNAQSDTVTVVQGTRVIGSIPVGGGPSGIAYDPSNHDLYVANSLDDTVSVIGSTPATETLVSCSPPTLPVGSSTVCKAEVSGTPAGSIPPGTVGWSPESAENSSLSSSFCVLSSGACSVTLTGFSRGEMNITADYSGSPNNSASFGIFYLNVTKASTSVSVTCSPTNVSVGSSSSCTATASGFDPTGGIDWSSSGSAAVSFAPPTCRLASGSCSVVVTCLSNGSVTVSGAYSGDPENEASGGSAILTVESVATTTSSTTSSTSIASNTTSTTATSYSSSTGQTASASSTSSASGQGGIPEFPFGGLPIAVLAGLVVVSYLVTRRQRRLPSGLRLTAR